MLCSEPLTTQLKLSSYQGKKHHLRSELSSTGAPQCNSQYIPDTSSRLQMQVLQLRSRSSGPSRKEGRPGMRPSSGPDHLAQMRPSHLSCPPETPLPVTQAGQGRTPPGLVQTPLRAVPCCSDRVPLALQLGLAGEGD